MRTPEILRHTAHRPWPLPGGRWSMRMAWHDLLFLHWETDPAELRRALPAGLELDTFDGRAWLGIVPFRMTDVAPRGLPAWRPFSAFPEINVRTYVVRDGKPGVFFVSLDVPHRLPVWIARTFYHLPYFRGDVSIAERDDAFDYRTRVGARSFQASYRPTAPVEFAKRGTFGHWATERYCLYAARARDGALFRTEIQHQPWPLQRAEVEIAANTLHALPTGAMHPAVLFSKRLDVLAWSPERVG